MVASSIRAIANLIADNLDASPSQVSLLFTSYMVVMGVSMLVTGWVSSRLGAKRTLMLGLVVIILGAGLAAMLLTGCAHGPMPTAASDGPNPSNTTPLS